MSRIRFATMEEALEHLDADDIWRKYQVDYQDAETENWRISHFEIPRESWTRLRYITDEGPDRDPGSGKFTRIAQRSTTARSTTAERSVAR